MSIQTNNSLVDFESASSITVLHVDDEPEFADMTASFLEREDDQLTVKTASSADEALDRLDENIHCVVSDYDMPQKDGIEFLETVREKDPSLPFILFTGKGSEEVASEAISSGVTDYLQKGTGTDQYKLLCNRIQNAVERYRNDQRLQQVRQRFQRIFEQSNDAIMIIDPYEGEIRNVNNRACEMLGYDREELLSLSPQDIHPHEIDQFQKFIDTVYEQNMGWTEDLSCLRKDGSKLNVHVSASTIELRDRPHMLALIRDTKGEIEHQEQQELFRTLLDYSTDSIYVIDPDTGEFVDVNDTACERLGYDREELLSMSVPDIDGSGAVENWDEHVERVLTADRISEGLMHQRKDGTTYPVEIRAKHVVVENGKQYLVAIARDLTGQKNRAQTIESLHGTAQELLQVETAEEVAEIVVQTANETLGMPINCIWLHEEDKGVLRPVTWTDQAIEVVGEIPTFQPGENLAWEVFETGEIKHYEDVSTVSGCYNPDTPIRSEIILPLGEYGVMTIGSTDTDVFDEADVSLAELLTMYAEIALNRINREKSLKRERERLRGLFETLPEPVLHARFKDKGPIIEDINPAFEELFGYDQKTVIGKSINDIIVPEERHEQAESIDERIRTEGSVREHVRRRTDDDIQDFLFTAALVDEIDGTDECFGIAIDISEQKAHERQLERQNKRLDEFASIVSHDLRNPLRVAEGQIELATQECESEHLTNAASALDRMDALIEDLLTLAREGEQVGAMESINLAALAENCWKNIEHADARLETEIKGHIKADSNRLCQLLENLYRNAIEHAGEDVSVTLGELNNGFYIEDDGPGIPPDERKSVFQAGYSTTEDGTGFGLNIVREIVEAHDWKIEITEGEEGGARFEITGVEFGY